MYRIAKTLNHNSFIGVEEESNQEYLVMGKGIAFGKKFENVIKYHPQLNRELWYNWKRHMCALLTDNEQHTCVFLHPFIRIPGGCKCNARTIRRYHN